MNAKLRLMTSVLTLAFAASAFAGNDLEEMREKIEQAHVVKAVDTFHGFDRIVFDFDGHDAWVVCPKGESRPGKPWTWTMQWAEAFVSRTNVPQMLNDGFHHVTIDTFSHRMDEEGLKVSAAFQKFLVDELGFAPKAYLIGMSWGGFFSVRYTVNYPGNVAKIYLDAPLLSFVDFQLIKDIGPWSGKMPAEGWGASPEMPLNMAEKLAATKISVLLLYGGVDAVVPPARNCEPFAERFKAGGGDITVVKRGLYAHHPHGVEVDETTIKDFFLGDGQFSCARPIPRPALAARLANGPEIIGIVHWGLNTYTDREWGFGDEDPAMLNPAKFDADQIVGACKAGGIGGLVVVAKHHDGFCLWPTKTTEHNITKTPFWRGTGNRGQGRDYVKEMEQACRRAGLKFGVYCSPWDRNNAHYGTEKYVTDVFQQQLRELLSGYYGEIFEMWFDGANGGDGYYGGAREKRKIPDGYYRYDTETFAMVRKLQPKVCIFNEMDEADFRFGGNERGLVDPDSRSTIGHYDGVWDHYKLVANIGAADGTTFHPIEADFPLRKGWFYHESERGTTRSAAYLTKLYLSSVGNASTMNIGIAPNKDGLLDADDVKALSGFKTLKDALFAHEVKQGEPFNVVVMREDISKGEQVDEWEFIADGKAILRGKSIGLKRIRLLETPCAAKSCEVKVLKDGGALQGVSFKLYRADPELVRLVLSATTESGETDTAKWMTGAGIQAAH